MSLNNINIQKLPFLLNKRFQPSLNVNGHSLNGVVLSFTIRPFTTPPHPEKTGNVEVETPLPQNLGSCFLMFNGQNTGEIKKPIYQFFNL